MNLENGGQGSTAIGCSKGSGTVNGKTLIQLVEAAIQKQSAAATLNSLTWGDPTKLTYSGVFAQAPSAVLLNPASYPSAGAATLLITEQLS